MAQILLTRKSDDWRGQETHELEVEKDHLPVILKMMHKPTAAHPFKMDSIQIKVKR